MKMITKFVYAAVVAFALACFALEPRAGAVMPAPDGGYPGGNTAEGQSALLSLTTGGFNTAVGWFSLRSNTTGSYNTATGAGALFVNSTGSNNTANGIGALLSNTTGSANTATGNFALASNTTADGNTANGASALVSNSIGSSNTAIGFQALASNTDGGGNTANGYQALLNNTTGGNNTAIGLFALQNSTGDSNIALGGDAGFNVTTASDVIAIGSPAANVSDSCFIAHIRGITPSFGDPIPVLIDGSGQLGTQSSSRRFKSEIKPMDHASESILALKPVTFHYKNNVSGRPQFGLIAEEVAKVNPDLVVRDEKGEIYSVRYEAVNAMLLNEFLKEHKKVERQQTTIGQVKSNAAAQGAIIRELKSTVAQQQKAMEAFTARLTEQAAEIQKVSAQLEMNRPAPQQVAVNKL